MPEQILPVLETHARRPQAPTERVLQVMHPEMRQTDRDPRTLSTAVEDAQDRCPLEAEDVRWMLDTAGLGYRFGDPVQHNQSLVAVLDPRARDEEHRCFQFGYLDFPVSTQAADFAIATTSVDRKQCYFGQMIRQGL